MGLLSFFWHSTIKKKYVATLVLYTHKHKLDVAVDQYVATLAHVGNVCKHKFDIRFIEWVATLAHVLYFIKVHKQKFFVPFMIE